MYKKFLFLVPFLLLFPQYVFAANTHHFTCADGMTTFNGGSCTGTDVFNIPNNANDDVYDSGGAIYPLNVGTSYYVSFVLTGGGYFYDCTSSGNITCDSSSGTVSEVAVPITNLTGLVGVGGIDFHGTSNNLATGAYSISGLCITDTSGDCESGGGGGSGTTTVATTTLISDPNRDFFNGQLLFLIGFFGIIWLFKKR
jgi:hypothetical protein